MMKHREKQKIICCINRFLESVDFQHFLSPERGSPMTSWFFKWYQSRDATRLVNLDVGIYYLAHFPKVGRLLKLKLPRLIPLKLPQGHWTSPFKTQKVLKINTFKKAIYTTDYLLFFRLFFIIFSLSSPYFFRLIAFWGAQASFHWANIP